MSDEFGASDINKHIEMQAYYDWQTDGCPVGRDLEYWEQARAKVTGSMAILNQAGLSNYEGGISAQPPAPPYRKALTIHQFR